MQISVELQEMFSYSLLTVYIGGIILAVILIPVILWWILTRERKPITKVKKVKQEKLSKIKARYRKKLIALEEKVEKGQVSNRQAYLELSSITRHFVNAATGIKVQNYTLTDIQNADMPKLYELIAQCYVPEFSETSGGDISTSIKNARKVVEEWN